MALQVHGGGARVMDRSGDGAYAIVDMMVKSKEGRPSKAPTVLVVLCERIAPVGPRVVAGSVPPCLLYSSYGSSTDY